MPVSYKFTRGDKIEKELSKIAKAIESADSVDVGFMATAKYPDGKPIALIAAIQDGGAPRRGIPPRPFFRKMVKDGAKHWGKDVATLLKATDYNANATLTQMGSQMVGELQESILETFEPPLSPLTLMLRKMKEDDPSLQITAATLAVAQQRLDKGMPVSTNTKPLVMTGDMLRGVTFNVNAKK